MTVEERPFMAALVVRNSGLQWVRENWPCGSAVDQERPHSSREAAEQLSPGRKLWEK